MEKSLFTRLLNYFKITEEEYLYLNRPLSEDDFLISDRFDLMKEAVALVKNHLSHHHKIFIYGDYDADGIMGTSILVKMFMHLNYRVDYYVPSRYKDGYGLTLKYAQKCVDEKVDLVILVDNGVSCHEQIDLLRKNNIDVVVLDHHAIGETLPNANYIIHPTYSHFSEIPFSGAFTAFMFSIAMLGKFDKYLGVLASISLISDMMPIKGVNRDLLRYCIENYKDGEFFQIDALKEFDHFDETSIGMKIAPKINAIGRVIETNEINKLVTYFTNDDRKQLLTYIEWINQTNEYRKEVTKACSNKDYKISENSHSIAIISETKEGLSGLIANMLVNKYKKPTIVFAYNEDKTMLKGSARAPEGFNIVNAFNTLKDHFVTYGGHAQAGGCSILVENFTSFVNAFEQLAKDTVFEVVEKKYIPLMLSEITMDNYKLIRSFSPFGENWKSPDFLISHINVKNLRYSKSGEHILTNIGSTSRIAGFYFSQAFMNNFTFINISGGLRINIFKGISTLEFLIQEIIEDKYI